MFLTENEVKSMSALNEGSTAGFDLANVERGSTPAGVKEVGASNIVAEKVLNLARQILSNHFDDENYRFSLSVRWMPGSLVQLSRENILSVELAGQIERFTNFDVSYQQAGRIQTVQIQLALDIEKKLPVATRRIMYGEVLDSNNLNYRWVSVSFNSENLVNSKNRLIGTTLRRTLKAGQPVRYIDIATEFVINAGDDVTLFFEEHGISISISAQARQDGEIDEVITIYSNETRTRYLGRVLSQGIAKWEKTL